MSSRCQTVNLRDPLRGYLLARQYDACMHANGVIVAASSVLISWPLTCAAPPTRLQVPLRRPDGDVELVDAGVGFNLASCGACGGDMLKPDVVFFGDSVPKQRVNR